MRELIALLDLSGLAPFTPVHAGVLENLEQDTMYTQTLELVAVAKTLEDSGFTVSALDYLLRHIDEQGTVGPNAATADSLLTSLKDGIAATRAELKAPTEAASITDEQLGRWPGKGCRRTKPARRCSGSTVSARRMPVCCSTDTSSKSRRTRGSSSRRTSSRCFGR